MRRIGVDALVVVRSRLECVACDAIGEAACLLLTYERCNGAAQEPRDEGAIEELELVVARDECLPEGEVDVVLPCQVHCTEPTDSIGDASGTDLDADLPQNPPEGDDVPHDRGALHAAPSGSRSRGPLR